MTKGEKGERRKTLQRISLAQFHRMGRKKNKTKEKEKKGGKRASPLPSPIFSGPGAGDHYP
jgi:hypothetical protein